MYIIEIIPIARGIGSDTLSYFSNKEIAIGTIVDVPIRKKMVHGIVISIKNAHEMKGEIKSADFSLKKIDKIKSTNFFTKEFIETVSKVSTYYSTSVGSVLNILVPKYILENIGKLKSQTEIVKSISTKVGISEKYVIQDDVAERYSAWKSMIRQEFARKKSIIYILPTVEDADYAFSALEKGIEDYAFKLHGSLTTKEIVSTWNKILKEEHPVVIVMTGGFLSIARNDVDTIIIESESSRSYKIPRRPYLDIRHVCEMFGERSGMKIYFADTILRLETLYRESEGKIIQSSPFKYRSLSSAKDHLIDMKQIKSYGTDFKIVSDEVLELIQRTKDESKRMIVLTTRRGISGTTVCGDCQTTVLCNSCSTPVVLHKSDSQSKGKNFFMCHRCGERRSAEEYCKTCGSWKLGMVGIGIDSVVEKISEKINSITIFKIDSDSTKDDKSARSVIEKFKSKPGSILIGTEMMLPYIHDMVENSAIISLDSLFALPDFRIQEKILGILIRIRVLTTENFIVQTRRIDEKVFEYGLKGNISDFYKQSIEERKRFNYPPFTTLIKITLEGKKDEIVKDMEEVQNILDPYEVEVFPAFTHTVRGNYVLHGLIRIPYDKWPSEDLNDKIRLLPQSVVVKVDPETLL